MVRILLILLAFVSLQCHSVGLRKAVSLGYEVEFSPKDERIEITGRLSGFRPGVYYFVLPSTQGQSPNQFVTDLKFEDSSGPLESLLGQDNIWEVDIPSDQVSFTYRLDMHQTARFEHQPWGGALAQISEHMAFLSGGMSFIIPLIDPIQQPIDVRWRVPETWRMVTPWSVDQSTTSIPSHYGLVRNYYAAFEGGSILQRRVRDMDVTVVWLGEDDINRYTEAGLAAQRVIDAALSFFGDPETSEHLTLILRDSNVGNRFRASTESNSIEFNFKRGMTFERIWRDHRNSFLRLLAHEIMHTWDRREVKQASEYLSVREWGPGTCWLREGFTEYFANLNLYRAGIYDQDEFVNTMRALSAAAHQANPAGELSLLESCSAFWANSSSMQYVYTEGASLAFMLDTMARRASNGEKSLPVFMRSFMKSYRYREKTVEAFVGEWQNYAPAEAGRIGEWLNARTPTQITHALDSVQLLD